MFQIHVNGYISLDYPYDNAYPVTFPQDNRIIIAPFWADLDLTNSAGAVWYQQYSRNPVAKNVESPVITQMFINATQFISDSVGDSTFIPTMIIKITWQNVAPFPADVSSPTEVRDITLSQVAMKRLMIINLLAIKIIVVCLSMLRVLLCIACVLFRRDE